MSRAEVWITLTPGDRAQQVAVVLGRAWSRWSSAVTTLMVAGALMSVDSTLEADDHHDLLALHDVFAFLRSRPPSSAWPPGPCAAPAASTPRRGTGPGETVSSTSSLHRVGQMLRRRRSGACRHLTESCAVLVGCIGRFDGEVIPQPERVLPGVGRLLPAGRGPRAASRGCRRSPRSRARPPGRPPRSSRARCATIASTLGTKRPGCRARRIAATRSASDSRCASGHLAGKVGGGHDDLVGVGEGAGEVVLEDPGPRRVGARLEDRATSRAGRRVRPGCAAPAASRARPWGGARSRRRP